MAKQKGGSKISIDLDDLLGTIDASIDSIDPTQNYDAEEARHETCISSGSRIADQIVGSPTNPGVLFIGRITEFLGVEGVGKTTLMLQAAACAQNAGFNTVMFDTELKSFSVDHMERLGIDFSAKGSKGGDGKKGFFKIIKAATIADIDNQLMGMVKSGLAVYIDIVLIDSIATSATSKQMELGVDDSRQVGQHAYGIQKLFTKIRVWKEKYGWAVGTVNQLRRKPEMGGMFQAKAINEKGIGQSNDTSWDKTGGRAYKHDLHQAVFLDNYKVEKNEAGEIVKQYVKITTTKNMVGSTGRKAFIKLVQNKGFQDEETLIESLMEWNYISHISAGNYAVYASTAEDAEPVLTVKGAENVLAAIKARKGLLDKLYDLYFEVVEQLASEDGSDEDEEEEDDEVEIE